MLAEKVWGSVCVSAHPGATVRVTVPNFHSNIVMLKHVQPSEVQ